jgi:hypothetical protein
MPSLFVVLWTNEWHEEMWGLRLGDRVCHVRSGQIHKDHTDELASIGFNYGSREDGFNTRGVT